MMVSGSITVDTESSTTLAKHIGHYQNCPALMPPKATRRRSGRIATAKKEPVEASDDDDSLDELFERLEELKVEAQRIQEAGRARDFPETEAEADEAGDEEQMAARESINKLLAQMSANQEHGQWDENLDRLVMVAREVVEHMRGHQTGENVVADEEMDLSDVAASSQEQDKSTSDKEESSDCNDRHSSPSMDLS